MLIKKIRSVKTPSRGTAKSAGIDFYVPDDYPSTTIFPGEAILIPSGIKAQVPEGFALVAFNKSGIATKNRLSVGACVVDEDYEGEIHLHLYNTSQNKMVTIEPGMKLTQFVLLPVNYQNVEEVNEFPERQSDRGSGGFGSTGLS
jgi:dUTP pyrophosphatase